MLNRIKIIASHSDAKVTASEDLQEEVLEELEIPDSEKAISQILGDQNNKKVKKKKEKN